MDDIEDLEKACLEGLISTEHGYKYRPSLGAEHVLKSDWLAKRDEYNYQRGRTDEKYKADLAISFWDMEVENQKKEVARLQGELKKANDRATKWQHEAWRLAGK